MKIFLIQGRPMYFERLGNLVLKDLWTVTEGIFKKNLNYYSEKRLMRYWIQSYEILLEKIFPACSKAKGETVA